MGTQSIVYGYIQTHPSRDNETRTALANFLYDPVYPFPNIFCGPFIGYQWSTIGFAGSFKEIYDEFYLWLSRFEELIAAVQAFSAQVDITAENGYKMSIEYVRIVSTSNIGDPDNRTWLVSTITNISGTTTDAHRTL